MDAAKKKKKKYHCKRSRHSDQEYVAPGTKIYPCRSGVSRECYVKSVNMFHCPPCLELLGSREFFVKERNGREFFIPGDALYDHA